LSGIIIGCPDVTKGTGTTALSIGTMLGKVCELVDKNTTLNMVVAKIFLKVGCVEFIN
jgi:hypothetical protein